MDGVVVYRLDRLARDLMLQETILTEIRRLDARVYTTSAAEAAYLGDDRGYAFGSPPYGYRTENGVLVEDQLEQRGVRRIRELRSAGASLRGIVAVLERERLTPKREGSRWHPDTVASVLRTPAGGLKWPAGS